MLLTLISDPHLTQDKVLSHGVDTQANYNRTIGRIRELKPDHVVLMGNYSITAPRREDVEFACSRLNLADVSYSAIVGNHDHSRQVAEVTNTLGSLIGEQLYYRKDFGNTRALFLDTSQGYFEQDQLAWIRLNLANAKGRVLIFMHHPPIHMGVAYMDARYDFKDLNNELYDLFFSSPIPLHIFCGHYHCARSTQVGIHAVHVCPSTYFQLDAHSQEFKVTHAMPGLRHVELLHDQVRTWVDIMPKEH